MGSPLSRTVATALALGTVTPAVGQEAGELPAAGHGDALSESPFSKAEAAPQADFRLLKLDDISLSLGIQLIPLPHQRFSLRRSPSWLRSWTYPRSVDGSAQRIGIITSRGGKGPLPGWAFGLEAYRWRADGTSSIGRAGASSMDGLGIYGGWRGRGFSMDARYQHLTTVSSRGSDEASGNMSSTTSGLAALNGSISLPADRFELTAGYQVHGSAELGWSQSRASAGVTYSARARDSSIRLTFGASEGIDGTDRDDESIFLHGQYAF